jgi:rod shape-determining protein MreD
MRGILRDIPEAAAAAAAAFLLYSLAARGDPSAVLVFNAFSLVVVVFAVWKGEVFGAVLGTVCGLLQDSSSLGVFGIAGLSKTLLGFAAGYVSRKLQIGPSFRSFVFIFICAAGELAVWASLTALVLSRTIVSGNALILFQPLVTAALGTAVLAAARKLKAART